MVHATAVWGITVATTHCTLERPINYRRRGEWQRVYVSIIISARCNIYTSRLCHDASPSVRLSVTLVHCGQRVRWIPDFFACLDRWMPLLLTENASPGSSDGMMHGFLVEEGGMEKVAIVAISLILLIFLSMDRNHVTYFCLYKIVFGNFGRKCIMSEDGTTNYHIGLKRRHIVRIKRVTEFA